MKAAKIRLDPLFQIENTFMKVRLPVEEYSQCMSPVLLVNGNILVDYGICCLLIKVVSILRCIGKERGLEASSSSYCQGNADEVAGESTLS